MKLTGTTLLAALAISGLIACGSARAQFTNTPSGGMAMTTNGPPHPMFRAPNIDGLARFLSLTEAQKPQVEPIILSEHQQLREVRMDDTLSPQEKMAKMKTIMENTTSQLQPILTPAQFQKWQMTQPHRHPMMRPPAATNAPAASTQ